MSLWGFCRRALPRSLRRPSPPATHSSFRCASSSAAASACSIAASSIGSRPPQPRSEGPKPWHLQRRFHARHRSGSLVQPTLGSDGALPFLVAACAFMAAGLIVLISPAPNMRIVALESGLSLGLVAAVPTAFAAFFAFGMVGKHSRLSCACLRSPQWPQRRRRRRDAHRSCHRQHRCSRPDRAGIRPNRPFDPTLRLRTGRRSNGRCDTVRSQRYPPVPRPDVSPRGCASSLYSLALAQSATATRTRPSSSPMRPPA